MKNINRTFTVVELGASVSSTDINIPAGDTVEVVDLTTRAILRIRASEVSIYRHTLHFHGKNFNIMYVRESV